MKDSTLYHIIRLMRPRQWLKNTSLFAGIFFAEQFFNIVELTRVTEGFIVFSIVASGVYIFNDIIDLPRDSKHPVKKNRPIPSKKISVELASILSLLFIVTGIMLATKINIYFTFAVIAYVIMQLFYTLFFKNVIIVDALIVAFGFVIRVFAGALAISINISSWLVLATIGLALLLAFGKRKSELTLVKGLSSGDSIVTRPILNRYPESLLDSMISTSASFTMITYSLFAFLVSPVESSRFFSSFLPVTLSSPKWMMLTIPIVIYGVARYLYVIYEKNEGESPERVLLSDYPLLFAVSLWVFITFLIYYVIT